MKYWVLLSLLLIGCQSMPTHSNRVLVHGHRGSRGTHPENTLPAFQEAVQLGVDFLELDLHVTKDDVVVIAHDADLHGKICLDPNGTPLKKPIAIRSLTFQELQKFDCGSIRQSRFPEQKLIPNTKIPSLEELLVWLRKNQHPQELNIETKMDASNKKWNLDPKHFSSLIIDLLRKHSMIRRTVLQSFDFRTLEAAKEIEPELRLSALFEKAEKFCQATMKVGATIASPEFKYVTAQEVERCHENGISVVPWTLNQEAEWQKALDLNVDAIISDYPKKLITFLRMATSHVKTASGQ